MATLELAANKGLGNVSMNMIADKVGIKKPSLYNHFASKEELVEVMYQFLREEAKKNANIGAIDYTTIFAGKSALEILKMMVGRYNDIYRVQMPNITPHVCRHTYCSNMAKSGMNPKTLQYLMGHSDISVTMNVYTHIGFDDAEEELKRMEEFRKAQAEVEQKKEKPMSQKMFKVV